LLVLELRRFQNARCNNKNYKAQQSKLRNRSDIIVYFNVNLKLLTKLINSVFCWCVNCVDFKMHGAMIKKNCSE